MIKNRLLLFFIPVLFSILTCCTKFSKTEEVVGNQIPYYDEIPTITIENYLNRMYIDLVGRAPLYDEVKADIEYLRANDLSFSSREVIAKRLQTDASPRVGEESYKRAYYHWFYERMKADLLEGADSSDFEQFIFPLMHQIEVDSLNGDSAAMYAAKAELKKLLIIFDSELLYMNGSINFNDMVSYMINNQVYDKINMNSFNYINATFDNLLFRFPSQAEFNSAFDVIEYSRPALIFNRSVQTKTDYAEALCDSKEFYQGMVIRGFHKLMVREPNSAEMAKYTQLLYADGDYQKFQRQLIISDEYAQFKVTYR